MSTTKLRAYSRWKREPAPDGTTWFRADRANPLAWALWPQAMARVRAFHTRYGIETDPELMLTTFSIQFVAGVPQSGLWMVVTPDGRVVGHIIASLERRDIGAVAFVWQYETDVALPRALSRSLVADTEAWGIERGAVAMEMWTTHDPIVWERAHGYQRVLTLLRKPLSKGTPEAVLAPLAVQLNGNEA